jgi:hypothetical protein
VLAPKGGQASPPELMSLAPDETVALGVAVEVPPDPCGWKVPAAGDEPHADSRSRAPIGRTARRACRQRHPSRAPLLTATSTGV